MAPEMVGRFALVRRLGQGAMGDVFLAQDLTLGRPVAIKRMRPEYAQDATFVQRFFREARVSARLRHPRIVATHDFGRTPDGSCYIVMEYVEGATLATVIDRGAPFETATAFALLKELCDGLAHAHAAGVVHRDFKPGNILCEGGAPEQPKIADFGLAKVIADGHVTVELTRRGEILGTPAYMSPEQARAEAPSLASDVYAWGCVAYHVLTGRPPFVGSAGETLRAHIERVPDPMRIELDPRLEQVVLAALAKEPRARPPDARALAALLAALPVAPPRARRPPGHHLAASTLTGVPDITPAARRRALRDSYDVALRALATELTTRGLVPELAGDLSQLAALSAAVASDATVPAEVGSAIAEAQLHAVLGSIARRIDGWLAEATPSPDIDGPAHRYLTARQACRGWDDGES